MPKDRLETHDADAIFLLLLGEINTALRDYNAPVRDGDGYPSEREKREAEEYLFQGGGLQRAVGQIHKRVGHGPTVGEVRRRAHQGKPFQFSNLDN